MILHYHMPKVWKVLPQRNDDLVEQLLINRGITTPTQQDHFFNPKLTDFKKEFAISA